MRVLEGQAVIAAQTLPGRTLSRRRLADVAAVLAGAAALAASARPIPLPWTPVPITAQTLLVLLIGALLGPRRGALSVLAYLAAGAGGLPIFAYGGGPAYLFGPTGGYLLGFVPAAHLTGALIERGWGRNYPSRLLALLVADAVVFAFGLAWLALYVPLGALPLAGLLPFLPGEAIKILLAAVVLQRLRG